jgi:putative endonuclease
MRGINISVVARIVRWLSRRRSSAISKPPITSKLEIQRCGFDCLRLTTVRDKIFMAWMYILECCDDSYYVGSTKNLQLRLSQHQEGIGANYTSKRLPVKLVYCEEYDRIDDTFYREKQVQGWTRRKREALINGQPELLPALAKKVFDKSKIKDNSMVE